jgi:hypothetical protein
MEGWTPHLEGAQQGMLLAGLLAGFAVSVVVTLITGEDREKPVTVSAIVLFTISTMSLLACLFLFSYVISAWTRTPTAQMAQACYSVISVARLAFTTGTVAFTAGVAALGWMHSRRMGIISAICALIALLLMVWSGLSLGNPAG